MTWRHAPAYVKKGEFNTKIQKEQSMTRRSEVGVSQEPVLGPVMFINYMMDISRLEHSCGRHCGIPAKQKSGHNMQEINSRPAENYKFVHRMKN